jgi:osmotically inducible lipoprotein OsmB
MKSISLVASLLLSLLALSACGNSQSDRALSGAAIGAGVGVVGGALLGSPAAGAAIGGAVGAGAGALTDEEQIDLGQPVWR